MKSTLQAILSDAQVRDAAAVEVQLSEELSAGIPWYDEA